MKKVLKTIFLELDAAIEKENITREKNGARQLQKSKVTLLGQVSLLAQPDLTMGLELVATSDLDALLDCEHFVREVFDKILRRHEFIYDNDSHLIFIPKKSHFRSLFEFKNLSVRVIDPESALVSKAVKAPKKNKNLIRSAIVDGKYESLIERILSEGGNLKEFT